MSPLVSRWRATRAEVNHDWIGRTYLPILEGRSAVRRKWSDPLFDVLRENWVLSLGGLVRGLIESARDVVRPSALLPSSMMARLSVYDERAWMESSAMRRSPATIVADLWRTLEQLDAMMAPGGREESPQSVGAAFRSLRDLLREYPDGPVLP